MIKAKLKVWISLILLCLFVVNLPTIYTVLSEKINEWVKSNEVYQTVRIDIDINDVALKNRLSGQTSRLANDHVTEILVGTDNPDIIITKEELEKPGYEKLDKFLYVPYAMFANPYFANNSGVFTQLSDYTYSKDMKTILEAIEQGVTWEAFGLKNRDAVNIDSPVSLSIPYERSEAYQSIREYFMYVLNNYKEPTDEEIPALAKRTDLILSRCEKVESMVSKFQSDKWFKTILFCPESIISEAGKRFDTSAEIVPTKTIRDEYSVYVKAEKMEAMKDVIMDASFLSITGFRNKERNDFDNAGSYKRTAEIFDYISVKEIPETESPAKEEKTEVMTPSKQAEETKETEPETKETVEQTVNEERVPEAEEETAAEADEVAEEGFGIPGTVLVVTLLLVVLGLFIMLVIIE